MYVPSAGWDPSWWGFLHTGAVLIKGRAAVPRQEQFQVPVGERDLLGASCIRCVARLF